MADERFDVNLLRMIAAELYFLLGMQAAKEMFGKSYFSLGTVEKSAVDQAVVATVGSNYQTLTPELLKAAAHSSIGFQIPKEQK